MRARSSAVSRAVAVLMALSSPASAGTQGSSRSSYAQSLLQEIVRRHPEIKGMELAGARGDGCVTIAATDLGDVGDKCDGKEKHALRSGESYVEDPSRKDPVFIVTEQLHDATGSVVGLLITDIAPRSGEGRAETVARTRAIRQEMEARIASVAQLSAGTPAAAPAGSIDTSYAPQFDPGTMTNVVTNPYHPLVPGTTFRFRGTGEAEGETTVTIVTHDTRQVMGIPAVVVHDQVLVGHELKEDTYDWYAQDAQGNVWYLGEDTKEYENGLVASTEGSWEAGVSGAKPGVVMWADPASHVGSSYRQEYLPGVAEDMGKVVSVRTETAVPYGTLNDCIETEDTTPLEPQVRERKFYCRGIGLAREVESAKEGNELVAVERPR